MERIIERMKCNIHIQPSFKDCIYCKCDRLELENKELKEQIALNERAHDSAMKLRY